MVLQSCFTLWIILLGFIFNWMLQHIYRYTVYQYFYRYKEIHVLKWSITDNKGKFRWKQWKGEEDDDDVSLAASVPLRPVHFSNWLTDGKSLPFGLVSDQVAINQAAKERERAARDAGEKINDQNEPMGSIVDPAARSEVTARCNEAVSPPTGPPAKRLHVFMKVPSD